jgi:hypothetical protein
MAALGDIENIVLSTLQQPGASFGVGSYPVWASLNNPQYGQGEVDYFINEAYKRACSDLYDLRLTTATFTLTTSIGIASYPIPPAGNPQMKAGYVFDVTYLPSGLQSAIRFEPGASLVSWDAFNQMTGQGYLRANSSGLYPRLCAIGPQRNTIELYPNPLEAGDLITVVYPALPTPGATQLPTLVAQEDPIALPDDASEAISFWALARLALKNNAYNDAKEFRELYATEIARLREMYQKTSMGDVQVFTDQPTFPVFSGVVASNGF